jgi:putative two-component system response regulator
MNLQIDPLKIAITKRLERDAIDELRELVNASEVDIANVPADEIEQRALALMEGHEVTPELIGVIARVAKIFYRAAISDRGLRIAEHIRSLAEDNGHGLSEPMLPLLNTLGLCASDILDTASATEFLDIGLTLAKELGNEHFQVTFLCSLTVVLMQAGLREEALEVAKRAIQLASFDSKQNLNILACESNMLYANLLLGRHSDAIAIITARRFPKVMHVESKFFRIFFEANSAQIYAEVGLIADAKKHLAFAKMCLEGYKSLRAEMAVEMAEGFVIVYGGDFDHGLSLMHLALVKARRACQAWQDYLPVLAKAHEHAGQIQEALSHTRLQIDRLIALQEKNILRYARLHRNEVDASTGEVIVEETPNVLASLLTRAQILEGQVAKIELMNERQKSFIQRTEMLERMAVMAALRDDASGERVYRVGRLASLLTHMLGEDDHTVFMMEMAARLHDIGKISIPDSVVQKAGMYASAEHDMMKMHTTIGADMLAKSEIIELQMAEQIARYHHEHWDGSGYPEGLKGEAIPLPARVVALADVFDALTHARAYRAAFTIDAAIEELNKGRGTQFEPRLVDPFIKLIQLLRREQIADAHGNVPANLDDLLGQSAKASPLLLARQKIWASIDSVTEAKQALLAAPNQTEASSEKLLTAAQQKSAKLIETLTPTEREVFKWVQLGKTNPEIAQILGSSTFTIKTHVQRIYGKLGVGSRVGLARLGVE